VKKADGREICRRLFSFVLADQNLAALKPAGSVNGTSPVIISASNLPVAGPSVSP
jgi:hypothetical protein